MFSFDPQYWAIIIGGSSGFGMASAQKLSRHGMNLCIVHRDRKGAMSRITPLFEEMRSNGVEIITFNTDAISAEGRTGVLDRLEETLGKAGKVRLVLHSIALGNLKLLAPYKTPTDSETATERLAEKISVPREHLYNALQSLFENGSDALCLMASPPEYNNQMFLKTDDFAGTIHAMGSNIVEWVQDLHQRRMFADDARVLSLTSEGNSTAWRGYAAVSAAKAVLESVSRSMAVELAPYGIRSNVIQAGVTDTAALRAIPGNRHISSKARLRNPFGRLTVPEDVANVVFLLCTDESAWINGTIIRVDGGEKIG
ncbi:MAG: SDR family oxidoreductase [Thermodesulfobacteriota bacterium]|nr:SDR family oxidoreductase [Thermodesulfobacteriota bacterium]